MPEPCPRGCGKTVSSNYRHTCIALPGDPEPWAPTIDVSTPEARQACFTSRDTFTPQWCQAVVQASFARIDEQEAALAECYRQSGADPDDNEDWRLAMGAVREVTRMRKEMDEADDRIVELEELIRDLAQSVQFTLRCQSQNAPDAHCLVAGEHRSMLEANLDRARSAGVLP